MKIPSLRKGTWRLLFIIIMVAVLASILLVYPYRNQHKTTVEPIRFLGTYQLDNGTAPQPLTDNTYIDACKNASVVFRGAFSHELKKDAQLLFFIEYLEVHIYLNGDEVYTWGTQDTYPSFMRSAGAAWGHCVMPDTLSPDDELTIVLKNRYANNYNSAYHDFLDSFQTGDSGGLARTVFAENWPHLIMGLFLFLIGITLQLFALLLLKQGVSIHASIYFCSFFVLSCSLWTLLNPIYSTLVFDNAALIMLLEMLALWLFPMFLFGYFGTFMQTKARQANHLLVFCYALSLAVFLVLQLLGITDAYAVRDIYNVFMMVCLAVFLFVFGHEYRHGPKSEMRTLIPVSILFAVFGVIEVLNYQFEWFPRGGALTIGLTMFITVQFAVAVRQIRDSLLMSMKAVTLEKDLIESRTAVMLSQIQPHFLYNSLLGIKLLCDTDPPRASEALEHFSFYLRGNLDSLANIQLVSFEKELVHIKDYLFLEKMRFSDELNIRWDLRDTDFLLPPLTVQPLIENAIRHGLNKKTGGGTLTIQSQREGKTIIITIQDDGVGFDPSQQQSDGHTHIGIGNTRSRLAALCGGSLQIESRQNIGTTATILLPQQEGNK